MSTQKWIEENQEKLRAYRREWYYRNKDRALKKTLERKREIDLWFRELKSVLKCITCEESHPACLTFHHRDSKKKFKSISNMIQNGYGIKRIEEEISKCDVLCANCHQKLHWKHLYEGQ